MTLRRIQIVLVLFIFWMLAGVIGTVSLAPGRWEVVEQRPAVSPLSFETFLGLLLTLAAMALICLSGLVIRRIIRRKKKEDDQHDFYREPIPASPFVFAVILLLCATTAGMVWWMGRPSRIPELPGQPRHTLVSPPSSNRASIVPPSEISDRGFPEHKTILEYLLAIAVLASLSWAIWRILHYRPSEKETESSGLSQIVHQATMDLESGKELSDVVLRCYWDMCAIMARKVAMREEMTAREFAKRLQEEGVHGEEVFRLTGLFERVRYGHYTAGPKVRAEALALLKAIEGRYGKNIEAR